MRLSSFWNGDGQRWRGYKVTTILALAGFGKVMSDIYWVYTSSIPLVSQENDETAGKVFYVLFQDLFYMTITGGTGLGVDYLRSMYYRNVELEETQPLVSNP